MWSPYCALFSFIVLELSYGRDLSKCPGPLAYYEALGCKPIYNSATDICATRYDCSHLRERKLGKCIVDGVEYDVNETISDENIPLTCQTDCYCASFDTIKCTDVYCPEDFSEIEPDSHLTYSLNECCATGAIKAPFATCKVDGKVYKEGERFTSADPCFTCICTKDWNNEFTESFCKRKYCPDEILYIDQIKANGAPVGEGCCADTWIYAGPNDLIISNNRQDVREEEMCVFGDKFLKIGDQVERVEYQDYTKTLTNCTCLIPPFITCTKKNIEI